jgi:hypothetical protein
MHCLIRICGCWAARLFTKKPILVAGNIYLDDNFFLFTHRYGHAKMLLDR